MKTLSEFDAKYGIKLIGDKRYEPVNLQELGDTRDLLKKNARRVAIENVTSRPLLQDLKDVVEATLLHFSDAEQSMTSYKEECETLLNEIKGMCE